MKQKIYIFFAITILSIFSSTSSEAGYYMKKAPATTTVAAPDQPVSEAPASATPESSTITTSEKALVKKQGFFSRLFHKLAHGARLTELAYVILAIIPFCGALAIGINDDFEGYSWLIALVGYFIFYFPGLIYTLIKMGDYY